MSRGKHYRPVTRHIGRHRAPETHHGAQLAAATGAVLAITAIAAPTASASPDWGPIVACESGGNPAATNPSSTASGLYQFLDTSWRAYGGAKYSARAKDATPAQQTEIANVAYSQSKLSPWAASQGCWGGKVSTTVTKTAPVAPAPNATGAIGVTTVRLGDTLSGIAAKESCPGGWKAIRALNGLTGTTIYPGQQLRIPR